MSKTGARQKKGAGWKYTKGALFLILLALPLAVFLFASSLLAAGGPEIASLNSYTHPDENKWYTSNDPTFSWSTAQEFILSGSAQSPGYSYGVAASGNFAYVALGTPGMKIVEMAGNPVAMNTRSTIDTLGFAWDVAVSGNFAYVADGSKGLVIIDVTNPSAPVKRGTYDTPGNAYGIIVAGQYVYLADGTGGGLQIIDVTNPDSPTRTGWFNTAGTAYDVTVSGNLAYVADGDLGMAIIDITNKAAPAFVSGFELGAYNTRRLAVEDQYAYLATQGGGLRVIDVSDPADPVPASGNWIYDPSENVEGVTIYGKSALVATGYAGVVLLNIDHAHQDYMNVVASYPTNPAWTYEIAVTADYVFAATHESLKAFKIRKPAGYSYVMDHEAGTVPDTTSELGGQSIDLKDVGDGEWYFHVRGQDPDVPGDWGPAAHRRVKIDANGPVTAHDAPSGWQSTEATIHFSCTDAASGCKKTGIRADAGSDQYVMYPAVATYELNTEGDHLLEYYSEDNAGNIQYGEPVHAMLDVTAPEVNIQYGGPYEDGSATLSAYFTDPFSGVDPSSVSMKLDGETLSGCSVSAASISCTRANMPLGNYFIEVEVADNAGNDGSVSGFYLFDEDKIAPVTSTNAPAGWVAGDFDLQISCNDNASGCQYLSYKINAGAYQYTNGSSASVTVYEEGDNTVVHFGEDKKGNKESPKSSHVKIDKTMPSIFGIHGEAPEGGDASVSAYFSDQLSGINADSAAMAVYGVELAGCTTTVAYINCPVTEVPKQGLDVTVTVYDMAGNGKTIDSNAALRRDYYWTWYDSKNMNNWVLMANRAGAPELNFALAVGNAPMGLGNLGMGTGVVPGGMALTPIYPGMMGGPVMASSMNGSKAIVSQRSIMGNSFEEVLGTEAGKLSDNFFWSWYDMATPGFSNWVMISNPATDPVHVKINFKNKADGSAVEAEYDIAPGQNWNPTFPGKMGGPVEVRAYKQGGTWANVNDRMDVMASQRVLSSGGTAFNELPGIPADELDSEYMWTWYDMASSGFSNWVLIANADPANEVDCEVQIAGVVQYIQGGCSIPAGGMITPTFPGKMDGPVTVKAWKAEGGQPADVIASQRITSGASFGEVPGYSVNELTDNYHWTWYDMTAGFANWIMIANPGDTAVKYEIIIGGVKQNCGACTIAPNGRVTPTFPGLMKGPVEVRSTRGEELMVSQRATRFGHFNEVLGSVLD